MREGSPSQPAWRDYREALTTGNEASTLAVLTLDMSVQPHRCPQKPPGRIIWLVVFKALFGGDFLRGNRSL